MRPIYLLIASISLSAAAPPPATLQRYDQLLASHNVKQAAIVVDKLIEERVPADGKPQADPLLNALIGRIMLVANHPDDAGNYLDAAPIAELPEALQAPTALAHGRSLELRGSREGALSAYREALQASSGEALRREAAIGIARQLFVQEPASARQQLLPIANGSPVPERWEARYLLAIMSSLDRDAAAAREWADGSWADAAGAPLKDVAPIRVQALRAALYAAAHDVAGERAMLTSSNGLKLAASSSLPAQLPVCGDAGVRASDFVIFEFAAGPFGMRDLMPVAASRREVVETFQKSFGGSVPIRQGDGETAIGTVFTASCRTILSADFTSQRTTGNPLLAWSISRGLYPATVFGEARDDRSNPVRERIDSLASRFGNDSPLLILPRWQLLNQLEARASAGEAVLPGQLSDLRTKIATGIRRFEGPEWIASYVEMLTSLQQVAMSSTDPAELKNGWQAVMKKQLQISPFEIARPGLVEMLSNIDGDWPPELSRLLVDLDTAKPAALAGRDRQAWKLTVALAERQLGNSTAARQTMLTAGLPKDACLATDSAPRLIDQKFSYEDYPEDLIAGEQEGTVLFEYGLSSTGTVVDPRIVYSLPSGLFDEASAKGLGTIRYTAPTRAGRPATCRGLYQPIRWKMEEDSNPSFPAMMTPQSPGPTT